jgi:N-acetyltransferase
METLGIRLDVLTEQRFPELFQNIGTDPEVYRWLNFPAPRNFEDLATVLRNYLSEHEQGKRIPHAVVLKETNQAIGTTSYMDLNPTHSAL